jgi:hypothetical protein
MDRTRLLIIAAVLLAVGAILVATGCQPNPNVTTGVGDSLTMTAALEGGFPASWDIHSMLGWQAENAQPGVADRVNDPRRSPARVFIALGQNDAAAHSDGTGGDGWTSTDAQQMRTLRDTLDPATQVTWIAPDYDGTDPAYRAGIEAYRTWLVGYADVKGDCLADWRIANVPADIDPADGVHLTTTGRIHYGAFITQAVDSCG